MVDGQPTTSESEIRESWQTDGYLLLRGAIPPAELEPMQDFISAAVDEQARAEHAADRLGSLYADLPFGRRVAAMHEELPNSATRLFGTPRGRHTRAFYDMYAHRGITSVLPIFLGPEITLHAITKIRGKLQDDAKTDIPWHQDSHYFNGVQEGRRMDGTEHMHIVTAWVPLVDTDEENGCLWVVPGSHRAGLVDWGDADEADRKGASVPVPMAAGDVLLFTNLTLHASRRNHTDCARWSIDFRYHASAAALPAESREREITEAWDDKCRALGTEPLTVVSEGPLPTWEEWDTASSAREAEFNARQAAAVAGAG